MQEYPGQETTCDYITDFHLVSDSEAGNTNWSIKHA